MSEPEGTSDWPERERRYWRRKLGRLKLGVEPLDVQLERYQRVTWALTIVPAIIATLFLALFTAFRAPGLGMIVVSVLLLPVVVAAWIDLWNMKRQATRYERERLAAQDQTRQTN